MIQRSRRRSGIHWRGRNLETTPDLSWHSQPSCLRFSGAPPSVRATWAQLRKSPSLFPEVPTLPVPNPVAAPAARRRPEAPPRLLFAVIPRAEAVHSPPEPSRCCLPRPISNSGDPAHASGGPGARRVSRFTPASRCSASATDVVVDWWCVRTFMYASNSSWF
jgi:hypothetical protein